MRSAPAGPGPRSQSYDGNEYEYDKYDKLYNAPRSASIALQKVQHLRDACVMHAVSTRQQTSRAYIAMKYTICHLYVLLLPLLQASAWAQ
jgi:hypothetical protein